MRLTKQADKYIVVDAPYESTTLLGKTGARFAWDKTGNKTGKAGSWWTSQVARAAKLVDYADDTCRAELEAHLAEQTSRVRRSRATHSDAEVQTPGGIRLYGYQVAGVELLAETPFSLLADQMGLGKTPMCIVSANGQASRLRGGRDEAESYKVFVLCPAGLRLYWRAEWSRFSHLDWRTCLLDSKTDFVRARQLAEEPGRAVFFCSPEALTQKSNYKVHKGKEFSRGPVDEFVHSVEWDMLIVDEAHMLKNPHAKRTTAVFGRPGLPPRSGKNARPAQPPIQAISCKRAILATGTPYPNYPIEVQPLAGFCHEEFANYWEFAAKYCGMKRTRFGMDVKGASNMHLMQERLRSTIMIRRTKDEVLTDLPPKVRQVIDFPADGMVKYIKAEQDTIKHQLKLMQQLKTITPDTVSKAKWAEEVKQLKDNLQVSFRDLARLRSETAVAKVDRCAEYIKEQLDNGAIEKLGIFAHHKAVVNALCERFTDYNVVKVVGGMSQERKHEAVTRFQEDPGVQVFVGSITAAGVGLTLTAASDVFFVELDWVPGNMAQAEDRFHRVTQKNTVFVRHLVVDGTLDSKMAHRLVEKQKNIEAGLDDDRALDSLFGLGYDVAIDYTEAELEAIHLGLTQVVQE